MFIRNIATDLGGKAEVVIGQEYSLQTVHVLSSKNDVLRIYIEGDGRAWARRNRPSMDPTPVNPLVLNLMTADTYEDKAYVARPCQYVKGENCKVSTWTDQRYSQSAIVSLAQVIDALKQKGNYQHIELIGYSGGATLALLVAAGRDDIRSVRTIAGNLDPHHVNRLHNVSPMADAASPANVIDKLKRIPQLHLVGAEDNAIPPVVFDAYRASFPEPECIRGEIVAGASHQEGWVEHWRALLKIPVRSCKAL
ncbi:hypothetical protein [uncultured Endozoicomonas sp.]|uniref:alpha/beta fold hydrolase n=1 Tax=uncultured Endozoicomonas sp. TaxID=432652 RepID=UPI002637C3F9|nr:hypothetical protein [uncultured Endozoicomonas sp.]